jgi:hypothetical protein
MKLAKLAFILFLVVTPGLTALNAQPFNVEKSEVFEEPASGWNQLLQLKNGNTFFIHAGKKQGIDVTVYDKSRKLVSKKDLTSKLWDAADMEQVRNLQLFEINGEAVLFLVYNDGEKASMYRVRLNPTDGAVLSDEKVASLKGLSAEKFMISYRLSGIDVEKDPASDCYALIITNFDRGSYNQTVKVMHFDGTHTKINEADFRVIGAAFKHVLYSSAVVDGNKSVYLVSRGYNDKIKFTQNFTFDDECKVVISRLNAAEKVFTSKVMRVNIELAEVKSQLLYNRNTNQLQLRLISLAESKYKRSTQTEIRYYTSMIAYVDPQTLGITGIKPLAGRKVSEYAQAHIDKDYSYSGTPRKMTINNDKTTSVLMEESFSRQGQSDLGAIGLSVLSDTGSEIGGYAITKTQVMYNNVDNDRFMSYDYVSVPKGNYVIFNDLTTNKDKDEHDTRHRKVAGASLTNTVAYKLGDNSIDRLYLFGEPQDKSCTFCYIEGTDFNESSNTYATVIIERTGREKHARVAWVSFN